MVGVVLKDYVLHMGDRSGVNGTRRALGRSKPQPLVSLRTLEKGAENGEDDSVEVHTVASLII